MVEKSDLSPLIGMIHAREQKHFGKPILTGLPEAPPNGCASDTAITNRRFKLLFCKATSRCCGKKCKGRRMNAASLTAFDL